MTLINSVASGYLSVVQLPKLS